MKFEDMINTIQLGNCYELIKNIPDKSIDLVYIDIPYLYEEHGGGTTALAKRIENLTKVQLANIKDGIDYSILDELCRIMKNIYIYIYGAVKNKYLI